MTHRIVAWFPALLCGCTGPWATDIGGDGGTPGWTGEDQRCYACHEPDWRTSQSPPHPVNYFPVDCTVCHRSQSTWQDVVFDGHDAFFRLDGKHATLACVACHDARGTRSRTTCVACHQADYDATTNPAHAAAGFPTDCAACHNTTAWQPATFNHDQFFPLSRGAHSRYQGNCMACHPVAGDYSQFTCTTNCHPQAQMDAKHRGRNGYAYDSATCYGCHQRGGGG